MGGGDDVQESWIDVDLPPPPALSDRSDADAKQTGAAPALLEQLAYTRILAALLSGSSDLSVSAPETERAWEIFEPFLAAWASGLVPLTEYPAGSSGPAWP
jgi:glucose-6-phosphate 1-dehydrogenase